MEGVRADSPPCILEAFILLSPQGEVLLNTPLFFLIRQLEKLLNGWVKKQEVKCKE